MAYTICIDFNYRFYFSIYDFHATARNQSVETLAMMGLLEDDPFFIF